MGSYSASFGSNTSLGVPSSPYLAPGSYTIDNGIGGPDVGPFKLNLTVPSLFTWNQKSITSVNRSQPLQITWTGGDPNAQVRVEGYFPVDSTASVAFTCRAKNSDHQLTVPAAILSSLPQLPPNTASPNSFLTVAAITSVTGMASGLDSLTGAYTVAYLANGVAFQ